MDNDKWFRSNGIEVPPAMEPKTQDLGDTHHSRNVERVKRTADRKEMNEAIRVALAGLDEIVARFERVMARNEDNRHSERIAALERKIERLVDFAKSTL